MAAGPLVPPLGGDLKAGDRILCFYSGDVVWHTRYLLACVDKDVWIVVTPDGDIYSEEVSHGNSDWDGWRVWRPGGGIPFGVDPNLIYNFNPPPSEAALQALIAEGENHAAQERARLGLVVAPPVANSGGQVVAAGAPAGGGLGGAAAPAGAAAAGGIAPLVPAVGGVAAGGIANLAGNVDAGGGHAALAQVLGNQDHGHAGAEDARTLAITRDVDGLRFKEFRQGVQDCKPVEFGDWPVAGPRTVKYVISQMLDHGGSALGHHQAWRVACKLQPTDGPAMEHEAWSKVLQTMLTYDQLDICNLASAEMVVRALQKIEEKHKFKLSSTDDAGEGALFMGASGGSRVGSIVCPKLTEWIGTEMQKEALVAKERRKAREERALSRKGEKDADKGK